MRVFVELTEYRIYGCRGWRVVQPNLKMSACSSWAIADWKFVRTTPDGNSIRLPLLPHPTAKVLCGQPDQFRRKLAIAARCLQETSQQQIGGVRNNF